MSTSLDALIPELIEPARALVELAGRAGVFPRVTSTLRTPTEQKRLYRRFQKGLNPYPVAPPGTSAHEYGYAFDMVVNGEQNQADLGSVWQQWGGVWGGAGDPVHFEYPGFRLSDHVSSLETGTAAAPSAEASVWDFVLGLLPGVGQVELIAWLVSLTGVGPSEAEAILSSPVSWFSVNYPRAWALLKGASPLDFFFT